MRNYRYRIHMYSALIHRLTVWETIYEKSKRINISSLLNKKMVVKLNCLLQHNSVKF